MTLEEHLSRSRLVRRLRVGPLGDWIDLYTDRLLRDGYHKDHAGSALHMLILFSRWMADHDVDPCAINEQLVGRFLKSQMRRHPLRNGDRSAMTRLISVLREAQVIAARLPVVPDGAD